MKLNGGPSSNSKAKPTVRFITRI